MVAWAGNVGNNELRLAIFLLLTSTRSFYWVVTIHDVVVYVEQFTELDHLVVDCYLIEGVKINDRSLKSEWWCLCQVILYSSIYI